MTAVPAVAELTSEQADVLRCLHEDVWAVIGTPALRRTVTALWLEREPTDGEVERFRGVFERFALLLHAVPEALTVEAVAS